MNNKSELITDKSITIAAAKATLAQEKQLRAEACGKEITEVLKKYNCELITTPIFTNDGRISAQARVIAKVS
jgi:hypothetical protein